MKTFTLRKLLVGIFLIAAVVNLSRLYVRPAANRTLLLRAATLRHAVVMGDLQRRVRRNPPFQRAAVAGSLEQAVAAAEKDHAANALPLEQLVRARIELLEWRLAEARQWRSREPLQEDLMRQYRTLVILLRDQPAVAEEHVLAAEAGMIYNRDELEAGRNGLFQVLRQSRATVRAYAELIERMEELPRDDRALRAERRRAQIIGQPVVYRPSPDGSSYRLEIAYPGQGLVVAYDSADPTVGVGSMPD